ncbi:coiled-coil domain-containing protein 73-like isoform X2 [Hoplias malabaricus]|uniref:coiled-coil domain-containing protein 73-like isoform X2 n=1 Tax=Hoplias malabaricus TaxID=27720 RepID=UPI0034635310
MEPTTAIEAQLFESAEEGADCELRSSKVADEPDSGIISIQLLEFRTCLLEAVEELHIHRDAETRYEAQICKLVLEKQELEWQKESLQSQIDRMTNEHSDSLTAVKKQAQVRGIEGEKGKHQLSAELKDKEICSLKEELKSLQLFKYSLEKKLSELEQKLLLQTQVKDTHLNQLAEVEKRFGIITKQCAMVKQAHEKLEQNVEEAVRLSKNLASINKKQESTIGLLKKDIDRLNSEIAKYKVLSICRYRDENSNDVLKEQQLQELKQRLIVEVQLNKKLRNKNAEEWAEKQNLMSSLQHTQHLLQTQTQAVCQIEQQLLTHTEDYQVLKREHEMIQERSKVKEDRLRWLIEEYKNSKLILEKEIKMLQAKMQVDQEELKAVKEAYVHLREKHLQLSYSAGNQGENINGSECDLQKSFNIQQDSLLNQVQLKTAGSLSNTESLNAEVDQISPQKHNEESRLNNEAKDLPDERNAECQEAAKDGCFHGENGRSENITEDQVAVTDLQIDPDAVVKQETGVCKSAPVRDTFDNGCPSCAVQGFTDSCLAKLSELETRSVYGVASDPLLSKSRNRPEEQSLGISEMSAHQTSDKHTFETSQDADMKEVAARTRAPEPKSPPCVLSNESRLCTMAQVILEDNETKLSLQDTEALKNQMKEEHLDSSPPQQIMVKPPASSHEKAMLFPASFPDTDCTRLDEQISQLQRNSLSKCGSPVQEKALEDVCKNTEEIEAKSSLEPEVNPIANHLGSLSHNTVNINCNLSNAQCGNDVEDNCSVATYVPMLGDQQNTDPSPRALIPNSQENTISAGILIKKCDHLNGTEKPLTGKEPSYHNDSKTLFVSSESRKETPDASANFSQSDVNICLVESNTSSPSSRTLISEQNSALPSGFQEFLTTLKTPLFSKHKLRTRGASVTSQPLEKLDVSSIYPDQKSDHHGEWNAIKQTFSEISVEKKNRLPISFSSAQLGSPSARSVGNESRHNCTTTPPPKLHSLGKVSQLVSEGSTPTPLEKVNHHHSDIRAQIAKIEQFLSSEGFIPQKKRKIETFEVSKP